MIQAWPSIQWSFTIECVVVVIVSEVIGA